MAYTESLSAPLKKWKTIKENWDDAKSRRIETEYIEPLDFTARRIEEKLADIESFVLLTEKRLADLDEY